MEHPQRRGDTGDVRLFLELFRLPMPSRNEPRYHIAPRIVVDDLRADTRLRRRNRCFMLLVAAHAQMPRRIGGNPEHVVVPISGDTVIGVVEADNAF